MDVGPDHKASFGPYDGDGIDVPIKLGFATFTFDVALKGSDNRIVVVECKAHSKRGRVKQGDIAEFANKVTHLRTHTLANVAGVFFTKTAYQDGAIKHATWEGISVAVCAPKESLDRIFLTYYKYDPVLDKRVRHHVDYASVAFREDMMMITVEEAAARCGLSVGEINEAIAARKLRLRSVAADNQKRILLAELNEYIAQTQGAI
ncbi:MAG: hypothetical protein WAM70_21360 [Pyrinomonadaceae bacterium]